MNSLGKGLLTLVGVCGLAGCGNGALRPTQTAAPSEASSPLTLTIADAKVDTSSKRIILVLEFRAPAGELPFNVYDPEYEIRVNGGSFISLGPIRWRHPFGLNDLVMLSGDKGYMVNYYYEYRDLPMEEVRTIAMRVKRADDNAAMLEVLKSQGCTEPGRYANTWQGTVVSRPFVVEHLDSWHGKVGRMRFREE